MKWSDPVRLADQEGAGELGEAIRAARAAHASPRDVEQLAARMAGVAGAPWPSAAAASALTPFVKALLSGVIVVAAGLGLWLFPRETGRVPRRAPAPVPVKVAAHGPDVTLPAPAAAPEGAAPPAEPAAPMVSRRRLQPRVSAAVAVRSPEQELSLLERARAALDRDPALALREAQAHARLYPDGLFEQEREVLAIDALLKLRRRAAAIARAEQFVERYPESSHARRVRALLDREGLTVPATTEARPRDSIGNADPERVEYEIER